MCSPRSDRGGPEGWVRWVHEPQSEGEVAALLYGLLTVPPLLWHGLFCCGTVS